MSKQESCSKVTQKGKVGSQKQILEKILSCQREISSFRNKCDKDIFEIEKNYIKSVKPYIKDRNSLILNVPQFWSKALLQHPLLSSIFEPGEKDVFKYLISLDIEEDMDTPDYFKVHFLFSTNPYFENKVLTKQFTEEGSASTTIKWKSNQTFPKASTHDLWEFDELGLERKGFFRWFADAEEQFCDPIADILRCHVWHDPLEFYFEETSGDQKKESREFTFR